MAETSWWRGNRVRLGTLCACFAVLVATFPSQIYPGDSAAIRHVARHLAYSGEWGIPRDDAERLAQAFARPGYTNQYLFENPATGKLHSRWGELNTLVFALPFLVERVLGLGTEASMEMGGPALRIHGGMCVALGVLLAGILLGMARRLGASEGAAVVFTLGTMFSGCTWHFVRAPVSESLQLVLVALLARWALLALETPRRGDGWRAGVLLVLLAHTKLAHVLLALPCAWLLWRQRRERVELAWLAGALGLAVLLLLWLQSVKFGSPFQPGIGAVNPADTANAFALRHVPDAFSGYMLGPNLSVWMFHPVLVPAAASLHVAWREHRQFTTWFAACFLVVFVVVLPFESWSGEWTVGPRYLLPPLVVAGLPASLMFTRLARARDARAVVGAVLVALLLAGGAWSQWTVARLPYLAYPVLRAAFLEQGAPGSRDYFARRPSPLVLGEFTAFVTGGPSFYPLEDALAGPEPVPPARAQVLMRTVAAVYRTNMLFLPLPPPAVGD